MKKSFAAVLLTMMLMLASGVSVGAEIGSRSEVYRWKDGAGVVHYSDTPPAGGTFTRVRMASSLITAVGPAPRSGDVEKAPSSTAGAAAVDGKSAEAPVHSAPAPAPAPKQLGGLEAD